MASRDPERRYQRDKVDQLELTQKPFGGIVFPAAVPPSLSAMRPKPTNLSATPRRPACPSRASGWSSLTTPWGFPCCVRFRCVHAVASTPAQQLGVLFALL